MGWRWRGGGPDVNVSATLAQKHRVTNYEGCVLKEQVQRSLIKQRSECVGSPPIPRVFSSFGPHFRQQTLLTAEAQVGTQTTANHTILKTKFVFCLVGGGYVWGGGMWE